MDLLVIFDLGKVYTIRSEMRDIVLRVPMVCKIKVFDKDLAMQYLKLRL